MLDPVFIKAIADLSSAGMVIVAVAIVSRSLGNRIESGLNQIGNRLDTFLAALLKDRT